MSVALLLLSMDPESEVTVQGSLPPTRSVALTLLASSEGEVLLIF